MKTDKHAGPFTRRRARRRARANYRRWARLNGLEWDEEVGGTVGKQHGTMPLLPKAKRATRQRHGLRRSAANDTDWYVPVDAVDEALPAGDEDIDGESTPVTRTGRRLAAGTLREYDPEAPDDDE